MTTATAMTASQTADYVNPLISATRTVFETMLGCTPRRTKLTLKSTMEPKYDLSAVIGITGRANGTIVLSLSEGAALAVLNRMLGVEVSEINDDVCDAVGELTNMIAGTAKAQLAKMELSISIPNVISGKGHTIHYPSSVHPMCIIFESEIGPFAIEVGFTGIIQ
jgi:chemotaxis protein CheX